MNRHRRRPIYITLVTSILIISVYLYLKHINPSTDTDTIMVCLAIFTAVAFFLEYHQNNKLNEAQFVIDLNNQFLNEGKMPLVEHDLERYFNTQDRSKIDSELRNKYEPNKTEHQDLVNYLVHLEGVAALINNGVLRLDAINDLMAYRYYIAVNNPVVQDIELIKYRDYYQGIIKLYPAWRKKMGDKMPVAGKRLDEALGEAAKGHLK